MASAMLLIDADLLLYRTTAVTEREVDWGDDVTTIHCDHKEMVAIAKRTLEKIRDDLGLPNTQMVLAFSGQSNFRKVLCPDYKANRQGRKPVGYKVLAEVLKKQFDWKCIANIEADDLLGIMQTSGKYPKSIIVSDDKDMLQIPGKVYRPTSQELVDVSVDNGQRHHMFQTLCGDKADNYPGLPGCGEKTAEKILASDPADWWRLIVEAFEAKGLTEEDALLQARLSKILHFKDYNFKTGKPILWQPKKTPRNSATSVTSTPPTDAPAPEKPGPSAEKKKPRKTRQSTSRTTTRSGKSSRSRSSSKTTSHTASAT